MKSSKDFRLTDRVYEDIFASFVLDFQLATFYLYYDFYYERISALRASYGSGNIRLWQFTLDVGGFNFEKTYTIPNGSLIQGKKYQVKFGRT